VFSVESFGLPSVEMSVDSGRGTMLWFEQGVARWRWLSPAGDVVLKCRHPRTIGTSTCLVWNDFLTN
jgi:hypothetical protein